MCKRCMGNFPVTLRRINPQYWAGRGAPRTSDQNTPRRACLAVLLPGVGVGTVPVCCGCPAERPNTQWPRTRSCFLWLDSPGPRPERARRFRQPLAPALSDHVELWHLQEQPWLLRISQRHSPGSRKPEIPALSSTVTPVTLC